MDAGPASRHRRNAGWHLPCTAHGAKRLHDVCGGGQLLVLRPGWVHRRFDKALVLLSSTTFPADASPRHRVRRRRPSPPPQPRPPHDADDLDQLAAGYSFVQGDARIALLPTSCKVALKRLACARSHLACDACHENGSCDSVARPCRSLCDDVTELGGECALALHALGVAPNCTATRAGNAPDDNTDARSNLIGALASAQVSNPADSTHDEREFADAGTACTLGVAAPVANTIETYDGDVCEEVVGSDGDTDGFFYVPPAEWLNMRSLAPLARPGAVQAVIESAAANALEALPPWASASCQLAARRVVCATAFPSAKRVPSVLNAVVAAGWLGDQEPPFDWQALAAVPQFPDQRLCLTCVVGRGSSRWAFCECRDRGAQVSRRVLRASHKVARC